VSPAFAMLKLRSFNLPSFQFLQAIFGPSGPPYAAAAAAFAEQSSVTILELLLLVIELLLLTDWSNDGGERINIF
jgi:hypothetical protein